MSPFQFFCSFIAALTLAMPAHADADTAAIRVKADLTHLPTGADITPNAAPGARFERLNPDLPSRPDFEAGQAVSTALSPDGQTLLVLTSGFNRNYTSDGKLDRATSSEYVFVYQVQQGMPIKSQVLQIPNSFSGLAWNPNGREFYVAGGVDDNVHRFRLQDTRWAEVQPAISLGHAHGLGIQVQPMAAGLAVNADGTRLLVANLENDSVSEIDLNKGSVIAERDLRPGKNDPSQSGVAGGEFPFWIAYAGDKAYISSMRDHEIVVLQLDGERISIAGRIAVGGQPTRLIANRAGTRLFVANANSDTVSVIDTETGKVTQTLGTTAPQASYANASQLKGSNPNSLALSPDESTLYVTNGGTNALAVIALGRHHSSVRGLIPTGWYPNSVSVSRDGKWLWVVNGKSLPGPNPGNCRNNLLTNRASQNACHANNQYVWQLTKAGLLSLPVPDTRQLAALTRTVANNNHWPDGQETTSPDAMNKLDAHNTMLALRKTITHVIYIVKENRTYDQVLGDLSPGNGDASLTLLPEPLSPNHHALARQFVTLDNFLVSGAASNDGWMWSTAARSSEYGEKNFAINYAGRGLNYDSEGSNRNLDIGLAKPADRHAEDTDSPDDDDLLPGTADVAAPEDSGKVNGAAYLWNAALRAGITLRNYGFFVTNEKSTAHASATSKQPYANRQYQAHANRPELQAVTDRYFRGFDLKYADFWRYQEWAREFDAYVAHNDLPALELMRLPNDHFGDFAGAQDGVNTVETQMADNDYALGQLIEKVSHSPYRDNTLIVVVEDDAQNGADHVDAHRSLAFLIGAPVKRHTMVSTRYTTVNLLRTIEDLLGLSPMGITDGNALPMTAAFDVQSHPFDYHAIVPEVLRTTQLPLPLRSSQNSLPASAKNARYDHPLHDSRYWSAASQGQDFSTEDRVDSARFNQALWQGLSPAANSGAH